MEDNQELVQIGSQNQALAQYSDGFDETGLDDIALKPSSLILVQSTTRDPGQARPGQFLDTLSQEVYDEITIVPLRVVKQRVMFPPGADLDAEPLCRSNDGLVPSPFVREPQSRSCATCPQGQWRNNQKPPCSEKLKLLAIMKDTGVPYFLNVGGKSITTFRQALQLIKRNITMVDLQVEKTGEGTPLKLYDFFFTVKGEIVSGKFRYAVMRFDKIKRVANVGDFGPLFDRYVVQRRVHQEQEEAVVSEAQADQAASSIVDAEYVQEI